jgi:carboxypeptidase family protein
VSDSAGRYELRGLPESCSLQVCAEHHAPHRHDLRFASGDDPAEVEDVILKPVALVRGQVLDPERKPVPGAEVKGGVKPVCTDARGCFEVQAARSGEPFQLEARKAGLVRAYSDPLSLEPGTTTSGVVIRMACGGRISGRVVDSRGTPVARGLDLRLDPARGQRLEPVTTPVNTDGSFRFEAVPAGRYDLVAAQSDLNPIESANGQALIGQRRPGVIVTDSEEISGLQIVLPDGATIRGIVVDEEGLPVPRAGVRIQSRTQGAIPGYRLGRADEGGRFTVTGLVPGPHVVTADADEFPPSRGIPAVGGANDVVVRLQKAPPPLQGVVLLKDSRKPVTTFWVRTFGSHDTSRFQRFLDSGGRFQVALRQGDYQVEAGTEDGLVSERKVHVKLSRGVPPLLELLLVPGASLTGTVRQPDGTPACAASIHAMEADETQGAVVARATTDRNGRFALTSLRPGTLLITASDRDWIQTTRSIVVNAGSPAIVDITLESRGARLRVEVKTADGKPIDNAAVKVKSEQGRTLHVELFKYSQRFRTLKESHPDLDPDTYRRSHFVTDSHGVLTRRFLPAGRCRVEVTRRGYRPGLGRAELFPDRESSLIVVLEEVP